MRAAAGPLPPRLSGEHLRALTTRWLAAALLGAMLLDGCAATHSAEASSAAQAEEIGVLTEGWHTGLILPAKALDRALPGLPRRFPQASFLYVGWGDRRFYMSIGSRVLDALEALLPSPSVLFVRALPSAQQAAFGAGARLKWLCLTGAQETRLVRFLRASFRRARDGSLIGLASGGYPDSRFFASTRTYDAVNTCNTWTVAALQAAGLPVSSLGVLFSGQVRLAMRSLPGCIAPPQVASTARARLR